MSDQDEIAGLKRELGYYLAQGKTDRAAQVRAQLTLRGVDTGDVTPSAAPKGRRASRATETT